MFSLENVILPNAKIWLTYSCIVYTSIKTCLVVVYSEWWS